MKYELLGKLSQRRLKINKAKTEEPTAAAIVKKVNYTRTDYATEAAVWRCSGFLKICSKLTEEYK